MAWSSGLGSWLEIVRRRRSRLGVRRGGRGRLTFPIAASVRAARTTSGAPRPARSSTDLERGGRGRSRVRPVSHRRLARFPDIAVRPPRLAIPRHEAGRLVGPEPAVHRAGRRPAPIDGRPRDSARPACRPRKSPPSVRRMGRPSSAAAPRAARLRETRRPKAVRLIDGSWDPADVPCRLGRRRPEGGGRVPAGNSRIGPEARDAGPASDLEPCEGGLREARGLGRRAELPSLFSPPSGGSKREVAPRPPAGRGRPRRSRPRPWGGPPEHDFRPRDFVSTAGPGTPASEELARG